VHGITVAIAQQPLYLQLRQLLLAACPFQMA